MNEGRRLRLWISAHSLLFAIALIDLAIIALWTTSYSKGACLYFDSRADSHGLYWDYSIVSECGILSFHKAFQNSDFGKDAQPGFHAALFEIELRNRPIVWSFCGFAFETLDTGRPVDASHNWHGWNGIDVPHGYILLIGLIPLAWRGVKEIQSRRRIRRGRCPACGYDLRESPARCPECGRATETV